MKKITKLFLTLSLGFLTIQEFAQTNMKVDWAVKDASHNYSKGLFCDKDSNAYSYGSYAEYNTGGDLIIKGSFLEKFSTQGNLILIKKWPVASFSIQKIIYDGSQYFYFTGFFSENCTLDGISISCKGNKDGMIGKMNMSGTILWITTFGGSKDEMGYGLCFGPSNNSLILAGSTTDSLVVNNVYLDKGQQSMLIAQFSLSGALQNHKLYDFFPQRDGFNAPRGNIGQEIYSATNGNFFVLASRQGSHLPNYPDTIQGIQEGEYVMKLNPVFDTLWTKFIIGPSDYGSGAGPMKISAAGDPYVVSAISSHYGGTGYIQRLDQNNGMITWTESHNDGGFSDIFLEDNTLFTCGTDSATYCPCPDQSYGYQDVKTFDHNNTMIDILKFDGPGNVNQYIYFQNITRDVYGNAFVLGSFDFLQYLVLGNDTIEADTTNNNGYYGKFVLKLNNNTTTAISILSPANNDLLNVFPNPASNAVTINFSSSSAKKELFVSIKNCLSQTVYSERRKDFSGKYENTIDLSKQTKGIYFVEVTSGNEKNYRKIVVE